MKLFVLTYSDYDDWSIIGIFSTKEKAEARAQLEVGYYRKLLWIYEMVLDGDAVPSDVPKTGYRALPEDDPA